ncbi:hypothetical protein [Achromobacter pestifer]|nr:hypothetical protein [Achromobacter pestifer]
MKVVGEGAFVGGSFVAMYVENDGIFLWISGKYFDLEDPSFRFKYKNLDGGMTNFSVFDSKGGAEILYKSWWVDYLDVSPGEGVVENFEEDFCAHVAYVLSDNEIFGYYKNRY